MRTKGKEWKEMLKSIVLATMLLATPSFTDTEQLPKQTQQEIKEAVDLGLFKDAEKFNPTQAMTRQQEIGRASCRERV